MNTRGDRLGTVEEHLDRVLGTVEPLAPVLLPLPEAGRLVLADEVRAATDIPLFDNSAMDGYAVRRDDVAAASEVRPVTLRVVADIAAGSALDPPMPPGTAARIMTGAPLPADADAVVPIEHTDEGTQAVTITTAPRAAAHIRRAGEDVRAGERVLARGVRLTAFALSAAAAAGRGTVSVRPAPRVAIISTGSELVPPGAPLERGQIPESNSLLLAGLVADAGGIVIRRATVPDDVEALAAELADADADLVVLSGGVSVGAYDVVKATLAPLGSVGFHRIAMQPGKPQAFGTLPDGTPVFGLPGNPVSVAVSFEVFVRPALLRMQGAAELHRPRIEAVAAEDWRTPAGRRQYMPIAFRSAVDGIPRVAPAARGGSGSHLVGGLAAAEGFAIVPTEAEQVRAGDRVTVMLVAS